MLGIVPGFNDAIVKRANTVLVLWSLVYTEKLTHKHAYILRMCIKNIHAYICILWSTYYLINIHGKLFKMKINEKNNNFSFII